MTAIPCYQSAGWSAGFAGDDLRQFLAALETELGRVLTSWELAELSRGWQDGRSDAEMYRRDMAAGVGIVAHTDPYPF